MSKDWDYAQMTKDASEHGGPEKYLSDYGAAKYEEGREAGEKKAFLKSLLVLFAAIGTGVAARFGVKIAEKVKQKKEEKKLILENGEKAREELLKELNDKDYLDNSQGENKETELKSEEEENEQV